MAKQYLLYLFRWQCSTPILAVVIWLLHFDSISEAIIANLIGGLLFYWVDRLIFKQVRVYVWWEKTEGVCVDCGKKGTTMRVIKAGKYNKEDDSNPQYRCKECANRKLKEVLERV
jgi:hypothetical protein